MPVVVGGLSTLPPTLFLLIAGSRGGRQHLEREKDSLEKEREAAICHGNRRRRTVRAREAGCFAASIPSHNSPLEKECEDQ